MMLFPYKPFAALSAAAILGLAAATAAQAKTIYVDDSSSASDSNPGTSASAPVRTLANATSKATSRGDRIEMAGGEYRETVQSVLRPGVSVVGAGRGVTVLRWRVKVNISAPAGVTGDAALPYQRKVTPSAYLIKADGVSSATDNTATIRDLTIDGSPLPGENLNGTAATDVVNRAHGGILALNQNRFQLYRVEAKSFRFSALYLARSVLSSLHDNTVRDSGNPANPNTTAGILLADLTDCTLYANTITEDKGAFGIKAWRVEWDETISNAQNRAGGNNRNKFIRTDFYNNTIAIAGGTPAAGGSNIALEIYNSQCNDCEIYSNNFNMSVSAPQGGKLSGEVAPAKTLTIYNNDFIVRNAYGIEAETDNINIYNNYFTNGYYPIYFSGQGVRGARVHNNVIDSIPSVAVINCKGNLIDFQFYNNTVIFGSRIPLMQQDRTTSTSVRIERNIFFKTGGVHDRPFIVRNNGGQITSLTVDLNNFYDWSIPSGNADYGTNIKRGNPSFRADGSRYGDTYFIPSTASEAANFRLGYTFTP